jgi:hypothetical protein
MHILLRASGQSVADTLTDLDRDIADAVDGLLLLSSLGGSRVVGHVEIKIECEFESRVAGELCSCRCKSSILCFYTFPGSLTGYQLQGSSPGRYAGAGDAHAIVIRTTASAMHPVDKP